MNPPSHLEVEAGRLRWRCNPGRFGFETTDELSCCKDIIGQDRALTAIEMGLEIESPGYNLYISGLTGTGKTTTVKRLLRSMQRGKKALTDICYVNNFSTPELPICIYLSAGQGPALKSAMQDVLKTLREHVPKALESENFTSEQKAAADGIKKRRAETATKLEKEVNEKGFQILEVQYGPFTRPAIVPVINGEPVNGEAAATMVAEGKLEQKELDRMREEQEALTVRLEEVMKWGRELDRELTAKIAELTKKFAGPIIDTCIREVRDTFKDDKVLAYLDELREYVMTNLDIFDERGDGDEKKKSFVEFEVNVVVDNSRATESPVIVETSPTYGNLFGTIERRLDGRGEYTSNFTMIRSGSMIRANNGYLVISLSDILEEPAAWPALKRSLKNHSVTIQGIDSL
ncbi:MAG: AAA family ATPase, partial [bacterium]|nr:AAA family ATPase [bacterium]